MDYALHIIVASGDQGALILFVTTKRDVICVCTVDCVSHIKDIILVTHLSYNICDSGASVCVHACIRAFMCV